MQLRRLLNGFNRGCKTTFRMRVLFILSGGRIGTWHSKNLRLLLNATAAQGRAQVELRPLKDRILT